MPRHASKGKKGFIWLPREDSLSYNFLVNSENVTTDSISSEFSKGVCPEVGQFKIKLINTTGEYNGSFSKGQEVELQQDFSAGTTTRFKGKIDKIEKIYDTSLGYVLKLRGGHLTKDLLDLTVTESYDGSLDIDGILSDLNTKYLTGYTISFTATSTKTPTINWNEKPFWDCVFDLCKIADADAYLSDSKVITFFDKNSVENNNEAIVWNDTLIELTGLGTQTLTTKNKIKIYGDDGTGLPVIHTSEDSASQTAYGIKELPIFDSKVTTIAEAIELGDAEKLQSATPADEGEATCFILPSLSPGDYIWTTNPPIEITGQYRVYSFTHKFPGETTIVSLGKQRKLHHIFKKRIERELALATITNPHKMTGSFNYTYDNENDISSMDSNVFVANGKITLSSGSQGVITHVTTTTASDITEVHLLAVGNNLVGTDFELSTDGGVTYETLTLNTRTVLENPGDTIVLKTTIQSANTEIDSVAVLYL